MMRYHQPLALILGLTLSGWVSATVLTAVTEAGASPGDFNLRATATTTPTSLSSRASVIVSAGEFPGFTRSAASVQLDGSDPGGDGRFSFGADAAIRYSFNSSSPLALAMLPRTITPSSVCGPGTGSCEFDPLGLPKDINYSLILQQKEGTGDFAGLIVGGGNDSTAASNTLKTYSLRVGKGSSGYLGAYSITVKNESTSPGSVTVAGCSPQVVPAGGSCDCAVPAAAATALATQCTVNPTFLASGTYRLSFSAKDASFVPAATVAFQVSGATGLARGDSVTGQLTEEQKINFGSSINLSLKGAGTTSVAIRTTENSAGQIACGANATTGFAQSVSCLPTSGVVNFTARARAGILGRWRIQAKQGSEADRDFFVVDNLPQSFDRLVLEFVELGTPIVPSTAPLPVTTGTSVLVRARLRRDQTAVPNVALEFQLGTNRATCITQPDGTCSELVPTGGVTAAGQLSVVFAELTASRNFVISQESFPLVRLVSPSTPPTSLRQNIQEAFEFRWVTAQGFGQATLTLSLPTPNPGGLVWENAAGTPITTCQTTVDVACRVFLKATTVTETPSVAEVSNGTASPLQITVPRVVARARLTISATPSSSVSAGSAAPLVLTASLPVGTTATQNLVVTWSVAAGGPTLQPLTCSINTGGNQCAVNLTAGNVVGLFAVTASNDNFEAGSVTLAVRAPTGSGRKRWSVEGINISESRRDAELLVAPSGNLRILLENATDSDDGLVPIAVVPSAGLGLGACTLKSGVCDVTFSQAAAGTYTITIGNGFASTPAAQAPAPLQFQVRVQASPRTLTDWGVTDVATLRAAPGTAYIAKIRPTFGTASADDAAIGKIISFAVENANAPANALAVQDCTVEFSSSKLQCSQPLTVTAGNTVGSFALRMQANSVATGASVTSPVFVVSRTEVVGVQGLGETNATALGSLLDRVAGNDPIAAAAVQPVASLCVDARAGVGGSEPLRVTCRALIDRAETADSTTAASAAATQDTRAALRALNGEEAKGMSDASIAIQRQRQGLVTNRLQEVRRGAGRGFSADGLSIRQGETSVSIGQALALGQALAGMNDSAPAGGMSLEGLDGWGGFISGNWSREDRDIIGADRGFEFDGYNVLAGLDREVFSGLVLGFAFGAANSELEYLDDGQRSGLVDTDSRSFTAYASAAFASGASLDGALTYGRFSHRFERVVNLSGLSNASVDSNLQNRNNILARFVNQTDVDGSEWILSTNLGYPLELKEIAEWTRYITVTKVTPTIGLIYGRVTVDAFEEPDLNPNNAWILSVPSHSYSQLQAVLSVDAYNSWELIYKDSMLTVDASLQGFVDVLGGSGGDAAQVRTRLRRFDRDFTSFELDARSQAYGTFEVGLGWALPGSLNLRLSSGTYFGLDQSSRHFINLGGGYTF